MTLRLASLFACLALGALGCDDSSSGMTGSAGNNGQTYTCQVTLQPTEFDYVVRGSSLDVTWLDGTEQRLSRIGGGTTVYGTWLLDEDYNAVSKLRVKLSLRLEPGRATATSECSAPGASGMATASSPAEITETTVTVLQSDSDIRTF